MTLLGQTSRKRPRHLGRVASAIWQLVPVVGLLGCAPSLKESLSPVDKSPTEPTVRLTASGGLGGAETCFNGLDDNGNRLIDEGCGVAQSEVQFVLAWNQVDADIDLYALDPDGEVAVADGTTHLGLTLSADCPEQKKVCHGQNYENAYVEEPDLAPGEYQVRVRLEKLPARQSSVEATLGVRLPDRTIAHEIEFFHEGQEVVLSFDVDVPEPTDDQEKQD